MYLLMPIGHRVDVLILSYGGNGEYPLQWCVTTVLVRSEHRTTAEEHDSSSGFASLVASVTFAGATGV